MEGVRDHAGEGEEKEVREAPWSTSLRGGSRGQSVPSVASFLRLRLQRQSEALSPILN